MSQKATPQSPEQNSLRHQNYLLNDLARGLQQQSERRCMSLSKSRPKVAAFTGIKAIQKTNIAKSTSTRGLKPAKSSPKQYSLGKQVRAPKTSDKALNFG